MHPRFVQGQSRLLPIGEYYRSIASGKEERQPEDPFPVDQQELDDLHTTKRRYW